MHKSNAFNLVLAALVALTALASMVLCYRYVRSLSQLQQLQAQAAELRGYAAMADRDRRIADAMASDALEFSKKNAGLDPLLQRFDIKSKPGAPTGAKTPSR